MPKVRNKDKVENGLRGGMGSQTEILPGMPEKHEPGSIREKYETQVTLHDGRIVGSWSEDWKLECEAKHLLGMALAKRREALAAREEKRGWQAVEFLKARMTSIHKARGVAK